MALKAGRVGVHPDDVDLNGHIKNNSQDLSAYLKKSEAPGYNDILTETDASTTYLSISGATTNYQPKLVSGTNIKTINNESLLGSGNITIGGGGDLSAYVQKSEAPGYNDILTETEASSTYQTQSGMSSYVLKSEASGYNDILTETEASSTYQTKLVSGTSIKTVNSNSLLGSGNVSVQPTLVSGTNIKTVNSTSLLGSGNVAVQPTLVSGTNIKTVNSTSLLGSGNVSVQETLVSGTNIKTINSTSLLGSGDISVQSNFYGVSTTQLATEMKSSNGPITYTATENCWVYCYFEAHGSNTSYVKIDNIIVHQSKDEGGNGVENTCLVPLCTGQTIELSKSGYHNGYDYKYVAYRVNAS